MKKWKHLIAAIGLLCLNSHAVARFLSVDPAGTQKHLQQGNLHGFNRYAYANNNPYKFVDPDGEQAITAHVNGVFGFANNAEANKAAQDTAKKVQEYVPSAGTISAIVGLVPGGTVPSIGIALVDAATTGDTASTTASVSSGLVETAATDIASNSGKTTPTNKVKFAIYVASQAAGTIAGEADSKSRQSNEEISTKEQKIDHEEATQIN